MGPASWCAKGAAALAAAEDRLVAALGDLDGRLGEALTLGVAGDADPGLLDQVIPEGARGGGRRQDLALECDVDRLVPQRLIGEADAVGDGQIRALISFIIQAWWPAPSVRAGREDVIHALGGVVAAEDPALQLAGRNLTAMSSLPGCASHAGRAKTASWSIAVPTRVVEVDDVEVACLVERARVRVLRLEDLGVLVVVMASATSISRFSRAFMLKSAG